MIKKFKKYSLLSMSLLLVLSNFSFATQQMLCLMNEEDADIKCECMCEATAPSNQLIITDESAPCCQSNTIELQNNNNLQTYNKELPQDITSFSPSNTISDTGVQKIQSVNGFTSLADHVPRTEIPILISSLRI